MQSFHECQKSFIIFEKKTLGDKTQFRLTKQSLSVLFFVAETQTERQIKTKRKRTQSKNALLQITANKIRGQSKSIRPLQEGLHLKGPFIHYVFVSI